jgi:(R,R)-butanediol dehydrogenase / meso-butanediol dehydrogenase / diacetyl reductase
MKAAVWHGQRDVRVEDVEEPSPGPHAVKIEVAWCGISGTDIHEYEAGPILIAAAPHPLTGRQAPVVMGHEFSGVVVGVGAEVTSFSAGDRVSANSIISCGSCANCLNGDINLCELTAVVGLSADGAFARFVCVPESSVYRLPDALGLAHAALWEPVSTGVHAMRRGRMQPGDRVAIFGGGPIGVGAMQAALAAGAAEVFMIEPVPERRALAERLGARALDPADEDAIRREAAGVDIVAACVSPPHTAPLGVELLGAHGRLLVVGLSLAPTSLDLNQLLSAEREVVGCAGRLHRRDFPALASLMVRGAIDAEAMITNRIALADVVELGFEAMRGDKEHQLKILVDLSR